MTRSHDEAVKVLLGAQVMIRNVDGGTSLGQLTPACASNLARGVLSVVTPPPAEPDEVVVEGVYQRKDTNVHTGKIHGIEFYVDDDDLKRLTTLDGQRVQVIVRRVARGDKP